MNSVRAIGFDLFNTLITVEPPTIQEAANRLTSALLDAGLPVEPESFRQAHRESAVEFLKQSRHDGKETHNRFWISEALASQGHHVHTDDPRIAQAVDAYFSAFLDFSHPLPGTKEMLVNLAERYPLGLLSNFTHAPAARNIIDGLGLTPYFDTVLISGELGYRKPHPLVFERLIQALGVEKHHILFVGDELLIPNPGMDFPTPTPLPPNLRRGAEIEYFVLPGDSIKIIAEKFLSTVEDIIAANDLENPDAIFPGQILLVPVKMVTPTFGPSPTPEGGIPTETPTPTETSPATTPSPTP